MELPRGNMFDDGDGPLIQVVDAAPHRVSAQEIALNMAAEMGDLIDIHDSIRRDERGALAAHYLLAVFLGRWMSGEPKAGDDVTAARFFALETVASLPLTEGALSFIHRAAELRERAR